ncbi:hypothetical protein B0H14DRAFT_425262 [Mycena olivaceomarginata]|nr:hypothetical protein B0H14DRAFT_425262 [Mycena olivaceomarginata]
MLPFLIASLMPPIVSVMAQTCGADACGTTVVPFWRSYKSAIVDHFYTASPTEFLSSANTFSYSFEGVAAGVFSSKEGASVPLFRLNNGANHFYTTNATEVSEFIAAGYGLELTAAWVYNECICGSHPLFRLFDPKKGDHFYTTSESEVQAFLAQGYVSQGIAAFVPAVGIVTADEVTCLGQGSVGLSST